MWRYTQSCWYCCCVSTLDTHSSSKDSSIFNGTTATERIKCSTPVSYLGGPRFKSELKSKVNFNFLLHVSYKKLFIHFHVCFFASSSLHHGGIVPALLVPKGFYQKEESDACDKSATWMNIYWLKKDTRLTGLHPPLLEYTEPWSWFLALHVVYSEVQDTWPRHLQILWWHLVLPCRQQQL